MSQPDQGANHLTPLEKGSGTGRLFIVSAPSGAGKTTLCQAVLDRFPEMTRSVSYTTRPPRKGERHGVDYYFIDAEAFQAGIESGQWLEWARVHGNYYGTSAAQVKNTLKAGREMLFNIDVQGADQIISRFPEAVGIFVLPPSLAELRKRLEKRGKDPDEQIQQRLAAAETEMAHQSRYHHVVLNDNLDSAIHRLVAIINGYRTADGLETGDGQPDGSADMSSGGQ